MINKPKIKISEIAYEQLLSLLGIHKEYSALRLSKSGGCCKTPKLNLTLDNDRIGDISDKVDQLTILYSEEIAKEYKEIIVRYEENQFYLRTIPFLPSTGCSNHTSCQKAGQCSNCKK